MPKVHTFSLFTDFDIDLFKSGKHFRLYEKFGSHPMTVDGVKGTYFAVWAPSAKSVAVVGDFNFWNDLRSFFPASEIFSCIRFGICYSDISDNH